MSILLMIPVQTGLTWSQRSSSQTNRNVCFSNTSWGLLFHKYTETVCMCAIEHMCEINIPLLGYLFHKFLNLCWIFYFIFIMFLVHIEHSLCCNRNIYCLLIVWDIFNGSKYFNSKLQNYTSTIKVINLTVHNNCVKSLCAFVAL